MSALVQASSQLECRGCLQDPDHRPESLYVYNMLPRCGAANSQKQVQHYIGTYVLLEKVAVMLVTSSADRPQIYSERVRKLSGLNHTKLEQDGGNSVRLIQDLLQA